MRILVILVGMVFSIGSFAGGKETTPEIEDALNEEIVALPDSLEEVRQGFGRKINELLAVLNPPRSEANLESFPTVEIKNREEAAKYCGEHFAGWFFWWSCEEDLAEKQFNSEVFEIAKIVSKRNQLLAQQILFTSSGKYFDSEVFLFYTSMVTIANLPHLIAIMANKQFNKNWIGYCNSQGNLFSLVNPIVAARRLNQDNILSCIAVIAGQDDRDYVKRGKVFLCKRKVGLIPRTQCLREAFLD